MPDPPPASKLAESYQPYILPSAFHASGSFSLTLFLHPVFAKVSLVVMSVRLYESIPLRDLQTHGCGSLPPRAGNSNHGAFCCRKMREIMREAQIMTASPSIHKKTRCPLVVMSGNHFVTPALRILQIFWRLATGDWRLSTRHLLKKARCYECALLQTLSTPQSADTRLRQPVAVIKKQKKPRRKANALTSRLFTFVILF